MVLNRDVVINVHDVFWRWKRHQNVISDMAVEPTGQTGESRLTCSQAWGLISSAQPLVLLSVQLQKSAKDSNWAPGYWAECFCSGLAGLSVSWNAKFGQRKHSLQWQKHSSEHLDGYLSRTGIVTWACMAYHGHIHSNLDNGNPINEQWGITDHF